MQPIGRTGEVPFLGQDQEAVQLTQVHRRSLARGGGRSGARIAGGGVVTAGRGIGRSDEVSRYDHDGPGSKGKQTGKRVCGPEHGIDLWAGSMLEKGLWIKVW